MSSSHDSLRTLDYSFVQQCMHCGFCLPTCPTYDATHLERNSPRGRIALMRAIADGAPGNGEPETSRELARRNIDRFDIAKLDAIITNAAGCGSHLKTYGRLLAEDKDYAERANMWTRKCKDINEFLVEIGFRPPTTKPANLPVENLTYHEACHLCHGQKITAQPRKILSAIPGVKLTELAESMWCCGSAGIYNIIQPEMSQRLLARKLGNIARRGASIVVTANPGCHLQLENGAKTKGVEFRVMHPVSLLAAAYRAERPGAAI
jgi:glycolate oxidase iron-sulfur subunit